MLTYKPTGLYGLAITLLFYSAQVFSAEFQLSSKQSHIKYGVIKFGSIHIEGELSPDKSSELSGHLQVSDFQKASDLEGSIVLSTPFFRTDSYKRDEALANIIDGDIRLTINRVTNYDPETGLIHIDLQLLLNSVSGEENSLAKLDLSGNTINVNGTLQIDRRKYNLIFKEGFSGQFDLAIANNVRLTYELFFETSTETLALLQQSIPQELKTQNMGKQQSKDQNDTNIFRKIYNNITSFK